LTLQSLALLGLYLLGGLTAVAVVLVALSGLAYSMLATSPSGG
jgi:hypothetical protein